MEQIEIPPHNDPVPEISEPPSRARVVKKGVVQPAASQTREMLYRLQRRPAEEVFLVWSEQDIFRRDDVVMYKVENSLEPATIIEAVPYLLAVADDWKKKIGMIVRHATSAEKEKFAAIGAMEKKAFLSCKKFIEKRALPMQLARVERFFDGSKIIFYFTAENRVDFRELVRDLVQEFRTRVEMRQIGVRHEAKMLGGIGCCGRPLCCVSFINKFQSVSIRMAKDQDLPLNPAKISGACNRLLCCLSYEADTYRALKKDLPKIGRKFTLDGKQVRVIATNVLASSFTVLDPDGGQRIVTKEEWRRQSKAEREK